jgi:hypothetical protein
VRRPAISKHFKADVYADPPSSGCKGELSRAKKEKAKKKPFGNFFASLEV